MEDHRLPLAQTSSTSIPRQTLQLHSYYQFIFFYHILFSSTASSNNPCSRPHDIYQVPHLHKCSQLEPIDSYRWLAHQTLNINHYRLAGRVIALQQSGHQLAGMARYQTANNGLSVNGPLANSLSSTDPGLLSSPIHPLSTSKISFVSSYMNMPSRMSPRKNSVSTDIVDIHHVSPAPNRWSRPQQACLRPSRTSNPDYCETFH